MTKKPAAPKSFTEARERLDAILEELERDEGDIDRLAARIKEASGLIRFCRERLSSARLEVRQVVAELAADETSPDPRADQPADPSGGWADEPPPPDDAPPPTEEAGVSPGDLPF